MAGGSNISLTPQDARDRAGEILKSSQDINDVITSMNRTVDTLSGQWTGYAAEQFEQQYIELRPYLEKTRDLLQDVNKQLLDSAEAIEELDQKLGNTYGIN